MRTSRFLIALLLGTASICFAQTPTWTQKCPPARPPGRYAHGMAYDAARGQVVLFGGFDGTNVLNDTWAWDGVNWTQKFPATSPPLKSSHVMAYDAPRQRVVVFGGTIGNAIIANDTWEWDGLNWTQKFPATSPSPRLHAGMAYDAARQQMVLFGGGPGSPTSFAETWVWDGTNWTQKFPATSPPARSGIALAYDTIRGQTVLFGGTPDGITFFSDTWTWDGTTWTQRFPATSPTTPRGYYRVAYDAARQQVVLFGGQGPNNNPLYDDTWVWDGVNWTQKFPATKPSGRTLPAMAYDEARSQIALFGGFTGSFTNDTWVFGAPVPTTCPFLVFPLKGTNPFTASISTVMDHHIEKDVQGNPRFYAADNFVDAYTGEEGALICAPAKPPCAALDIEGNQQQPSGYKNTLDEPFTVNGHYTGGSGCYDSNNQLLLNCQPWLFYEGHPGFDYPASLGTDVYAAADGVAFIPDCDPVTRKSDCTGTSPGAAVDGFNILTVDHGNGYSTWYLHMGDLEKVNRESATIPKTPFQVMVAHAAGFQTDRGVVYSAKPEKKLKKVPSNPSSGQYSVDTSGIYTFAAADTGFGVLISYDYAVDFRLITCPAQPRIVLHRGDGQRVPVTTQCTVGGVGNKALNKRNVPIALGAHLHFEVRKGLTKNTDGSYQCLLPTCVPVDPYGWTSATGQDPYPFGPNVLLWK